MQSDFDLLPVEHQRVVQPGAPVQVCCSRRCRAWRSGVSFAQVRLLNRSDHRVGSVYLRLEGMDAADRRCFLLDETVLAKLEAPGHSLFGETRMLALPGACSSLRVLVRRVVFSDGTRWSWDEVTPPAAPEALGWSRCVCGCWNGPEVEDCALCRASLGPMAAVEEPQQPLQLHRPRPAPISREQPDPVAAPQRKRLPGWAILLIFLGIVTTLALLALFITFQFDPAFFEWL